MRRTSRRAGSFPPVALLALLGAALASPSPAAVYTVGAGGPPCTHANLEEAITEAAVNTGPDEIRVARNQAYSVFLLHLTDFNPETIGALSIRGGYDDCADPAPDGRTQLVGDLDSTAITVETVFGKSSEITLVGLEIRDSGVNGVRIEDYGRVIFENTKVFSNSGSGIVVDSFAEAYLDPNSEVAENGNSGIVCYSASTVVVAGYVLDNSGPSGGGISARNGCQLYVRSPALILGNSATSGGGIYAEGGAIVDVDGTDPGLDETLIDGNTASGSGGGIYATGVGTTVTIHDASVTSNEAGNQGGGIYASNGSQLYVRSPAAILGNSATSGGGIYADSGAIVDIDGTDPGLDETLIDGNTASGSGGGIYAVGAGTMVTIHNASVTSNEAVNQGGGIVAWQGASVVMGRVNGGCQERCSELSGNSLTSGHLGAAAWAGTGANLTISQTYVDSNTIPIASPTGNVLFATGAGTTLTVEGVGMWNNQGPDSLVEGFDSAVVHLAFVSATGNVHGDGDLPAIPIRLGNGATGTLGSSIFYPNSPAVGAGDLSDIDCLIVSNSTGLSGGDYVNTVDPLFLDPANGDLHLPPNSPAVDYCDDIVTVPQHSDIDHEMRGFDLAANANGSPGVPGGTFDIGFDEHRGLFGDGFETGDTGAWSSTGS